MTLTASTLAQMRELHERATPGPWESSPCDDGLWIVHTGGDVICEIDINREADDGTHKARADLIALLRNNLPALLDAAQERDRLREALDQLLIASKILFQNSVGCASNHHGWDTELNGLPGWLSDASATIVAADAAIRKLKG